MHRRSPLGGRRHATTGYARKPAGVSRSTTCYHHVRTLSFYLDFGSAYGTCPCLDRQPTLHGYTLACACMISMYPPCFTGSLSQVRTLCNAQKATASLTKLSIHTCMQDNGHSVYLQD